MNPSAVDELFEQSKERSWRDAGEEALLEFEFSSSDPEGLDGISHDPPPNEDPEIEFRYDMTGRGEKVRCVYCKYPNHYKGIVVRYPSGSRRLVGRDCALNHYGVEFEKHLNEFDAAIERQGYARRRRALMAACAQIFREFQELKADPAVETHDRLMSQWRTDLRDLAPALINIARRDERLTISRKERDEAAEKLRKQRLGDRFEEERQKAKAAGEIWQIYRTIDEDLGSLGGALFFTGSVPVAKRLDEIRLSVQQVLRTLSRDDLPSRQISGCFRKLAELRDELAHEFNRLEALAAAFDANNLTQIAKWANEQVAEQIRREAALENRKPGYIPTRFTTNGQSISDRMGLHQVTISLPTAYRSAPNTLLAILKDVSSID